METLRGAQLRRGIFQQGGPPEAGLVTLHVSPLAAQFAHRTEEDPTCQGLCCLCVQCVRSLRFGLFEAAGWVNEVLSRTEEKHQELPGPKWHVEPCRLRFPWNSKGEPVGERPERVSIDVYMVSERSGGGPGRTGMQLLANNPAERRKQQQQRQKPCGSSAATAGRVKTCVAVTIHETVGEGEETYQTVSRLMFNVASKRQAPKLLCRI